MKRTVSSFLLPIVVIALLVQTVLVADSYAVTVKKGDRAPLFTSEKLEGGTFELKEYLGKNIVLLNFWSVFCRDCISRIEALNKINDLYQKRDFELVGIAGDPPTARMLSQVKKYASKMHYDVILDPELEVFDSYGVEIIPFAVLVNRDGTVVMAIKSLDPGPLKQLSDAIDMLTKE